MDRLKKIGSALARPIMATFGVIAYVFVLIAPAFLTTNETLILSWVGLVVFLSFYGAILHTVANEKDKSLPYLQRVRMSAKEAAKKFGLGLGLIGGLILVAAWLQDDNSSSAASSATMPPSTYAQPTTYTPTPTDIPTYSPATPVHYDSSYKYNYRSGYTGNYDYNYDVEGYSDDSGNYYSGNIDTEGKYGSGYLYDEDGNEIYVDTEWTGYGQIEATDEDGNTYDLGVE